MNAVEWNTCNDIYELSQYLKLKNIFDSTLWREFHCKCCRRIWKYILDENAKRAIVVAERYLANEVSIDQLRSVHTVIVKKADQVWQNVYSMRISSKENEAVWPISEKVDIAWVAYLVVDAVKVVTQDEIDFLSIPEAAASVPAWAQARKKAAMNCSDNSEDYRDIVEKYWQNIRELEETKQADILRSIFGRKEKGASIILTV